MLGGLAIAAAMTVWVGFALSTRAISRSGLSLAEVSLIRYVTPVALLAPWWCRAWQEVQRSSSWDCALLALGGGMPFLVLTAVGARSTSAAHISIINLGVPPLLIAALGYLTKTPSRSHDAPPRTAATATSRPAQQRQERGGPRPRGRDFMQAGAAAIAAGVAILAFATPGAGPGVLLLLASALLWTALTVSQARMNLSPITTALIISAPSAALASAWVASSVIASPAPPTIEVQQVILLVLVQGIGSGVISALSYSSAISHLGGPRAALLAALTPVFVATSSTALLHEPLPGASHLALVLVVLGVMLQVRTAEASRPASM